MFNKSFNNFFFHLLPFKVSCQQQLENGIPLPRYNRTSSPGCANKYHMGIGLILQGCFKVRETAFRGKVAFR